MDSGANFLYETLNAVESMGFLKKDIPDSVRLNLNPHFELRPYQVRGSVRFAHCCHNGSPNKTCPLHFPFSMATGSRRNSIALAHSRRQNIAWYARPDVSAPPLRGARG